MYAQTDPAWGEKLLGESGLRMRDFGCTVTGVSNSFRAAGWTDITPGFLVDALSALPKDAKGNTGFTPDGLIIWARLREVIPAHISYQFALDDRYYYKIVRGVWGKYLHWVLRYSLPDGVVTINSYDGQAYINNFQENGSIRSFDITPPNFVPPTTTPEPSTEPTPAPQEATYTVQAGDTLGQIVLDHYGAAADPLWGADGSVAKVAAHNGVADPNLIHPGDVIRFPNL